MQPLWFVSPWLTSKHRHTDSIWSAYVNGWASWAKNAENRPRFELSSAVISQFTSTTSIRNYTSSILGANADTTIQKCLVLSCPCRRCGQNWRQDKTVLSCFVDPVSNLQLFSLKYVEDYWKLGNWKLDRDKTKLSCLVTKSVHTAETDMINSFVLSVSAVWTRHTEQPVTH